MKPTIGLKPGKNVSWEQMPNDINWSACELIEPIILEFWTESLNP
jgi:hypothetical protein